MEIYLADGNGNTYDVIDEYESIIWTERYTELGDFKFVLPLTRKNLERFRVGVTVRVSDSREAGIIDTRLTENGTITVSGKSIEVLLDNFIIAPDRPKEDLTITDTAGGIIKRIIYLIAPLTQFPGSEEGIALGSLDETGDVVTEVVNPGSAYNEILTIAKKYGIGIKARLRTNTDRYSVDQTPVFTLTTYRGLDRTRNQIDREMVLFSSSLDNLQGVKVLTSNVDAVARVLVYPPEDLRDEFELAYPFRNGHIVVQPRIKVKNGSGFLDFDDYTNTKTIAIVADNLKANMIGARGDGEPTLGKLLRDVGARELLKHGLTRAIDGEIISQETLKYGRDFDLGDLVQLEDYEYSFTKDVAMISEFIRSSDATGERAYPTVTVPQTYPEGYYPTGAFHRVDQPQSDEELSY